MVRETEKAKGDFDYILDLERVSANPEIIVRGNPDESKLANMVDDDIMPDAEVGEEPLPPEEKKASEDGFWPAPRPKKVTFPL